MGWNSCRNLVVVLIRDPSRPRRALELNVALAQAQPGYNCPDLPCHLRMIGSKPEDRVGRNSRAALRDWKVRVEPVENLSQRLELVWRNATAIPQRVPRREHAARVSVVQRRNAGDC